MSEIFGRKPEIRAIPVETFVMHFRADVPVNVAKDEWRRQVRRRGMSPASEPRYYKGEVEGEMVQWPDLDIPPRRHRTHIFVSVQPGDLAPSS